MYFSIGEKNTIFHLYIHGILFSYKPFHLVGYEVTNIIQMIYDWCFEIICLCIVLWQFTAIKLLLESKKPDIFAYNRLYSCIERLFKNTKIDLCNIIKRVITSYSFEISFFAIIIELIIKRETYSKGFVNSTFC